MVVPTAGSARMVEAAVIKAMKEGGYALLSDIDARYRHGPTDRD